MNAAIAFIFVTVLLDMLALGVMIPVLPRLVVEFLGGDNAPALFTLVFAAFVGPLRDVGLPGAPFYVAALLLVAAVLVSGRATRQLA